MDAVDKLNEKQAKLREEQSEVKLQIAARHGQSEHSDHDVLPTREPADKLQAELSEKARKAESAASPTAPADPADDPDEVKEARGDGDAVEVTGTESNAVKATPGMTTATVRK